MSPSDIEIFVHKLSPSRILLSKVLIDVDVTVEDLHCSVIPSPRLISFLFCLQVYNKFNRNTVAKVTGITSFAKMAGTIKNLQED